MTDAGDKPLPATSKAGKRTKRRPAAMARVVVVGASTSATFALLTGMALDQVAQADAKAATTTPTAAPAPDPTSAIVAPTVTTGFATPTDPADPAIADPALADPGTPATDPPAEGPAPGGPAAAPPTTATRPAPTGAAPAPTATPQPARPVPTAPRATPAPTAAPAPPPTAKPAPPPTAPPRTTPPTTVTKASYEIAMTGQLWWFVARASGIVAWVLATGSVLWGLALSTRALGKRPAAPWLLDLHGFLGNLTVVFVGVHLVALFFDTYVHFGLSELFVPLASSWKPLPVAYGIVATYLLAAIMVTSWTRRWIPKRLWHGIHLASYGVYVLGTVHLLTAGTDGGNIALRLTALSSVGAVAFFSFYRKIGPGRAASVRRPTRPAEAGPTPVPVPVPTVVPRSGDLEPAAHRRSA